MLYSPLGSFSSRFSRRWVPSWPCARDYRESGRERLLCRIRRGYNRWTTCHRGNSNRIREWFRVRDSDVYLPGSNGTRRWKWHCRNRSNALLCFEGLFWFGNHADVSVRVLLRWGRGCFTALHLTSYDSLDTSRMFSGFKSVWTRFNECKTYKISIQDSERGQERLTGNAF